MTNAPVTDPGVQTARTQPDPNSWEVQFLQALQTGYNQKYGTNIQLQPTPTNIAILDGWAKSEGTIGSNNPFAISGQNPGSTNCLAQCGSGSPVYAYDSITSGINANVQFILNNGFNGNLRPQGYATFVPYMAQSTYTDSSLQAAQIARDVFTVINQSGWCAGCQNGNYPNGLLAVIQDFEKGITPSQSGAVTPTSATGIVGDYVQAGAQAATSWTQSLGTILGKLTSKQFWLRVGLFMAGLLLGLIGISFILSESKTVTNASKVVPVPI